MAGDRKIYMGSGNYNESIQGYYIEGNFINTGQDLSQVTAQIQ